jgi:hypothetical protein
VGRQKYAWPVIAATFALAVTCPVATAGAATEGTAHVQAKLVGVWHKKMTKAEWDRVGAIRDVGIYTIVIKRSGKVIVYLPGTYRPLVQPLQSRF